MDEKILDSYDIIRKIPENYVHGELDFCKTEFSYQTYDVRLVELKNCIVTRRGFIYEEARLKMNSISLLDESRYTSLLTRKHYLRKVFFKNKKRVGDMNYLLAHDDWSNEHYHWFCDALPRLFVIKDRLKDFILLLPESEYIRDVGIKSLAFFGLAPSDIEFIGGDDLVKVKNLSIITHTCLTGYINDLILYDMRKFILSKFDQFDNERRKLYITRDRARYRKILNEATVKDIICDFGYETVRYEDMPWEDQVVLSSKAQSIVGLHGAGLVNMIYMRPNGKILEFRRDKIYHNQCFWHLSQAAHLKYYYLFGAPDDENLVIEGNGCNLTINSEKLIDTLALMDSK